MRRLLFTLAFVLLSQPVLAQTTSVSVDYLGANVGMLTAAWHSSDPLTDHDDDQDTVEQRGYRNLRAWLKADLKAYLNGKVDYQQELSAKSGCRGASSTRRTAIRDAAGGFDPCAK